METVALKRRKNKVWGQEQDDDQNNANDDFETDQRFYAKRKVLKTWGFYNERFKQGWEQYVASPEGTQIGALYLGTMIFLEIMCRYIARKNSKVDLCSPRMKTKPNNPRRTRTAACESPIREPTTPLTTCSGRERVAETYLVKDQLSKSTT